MVKVVPARRPNAALLRELSRPARALIRAAKANRRGDLEATMIRIL
jgi:hypothetical protein